MALPVDLLNARLLAVERPTRDGPGGDITARTSLYSAATLGAFDVVYEPTDNLVRLPDAREIRLDVYLYVDRLRASGALLEIAVGDEVTWLDLNEVTHRRAEVRQAALLGWPGSDVDHWELGLTGA